MGQHLLLRHPLHQITSQSLEQEISDNGQYNLWYNKTGGIMKMCTKCLISKDSSNFTVKNPKTGNLFTHCRDCRSKYNKENAAIPEVMTKRREQKKLYWEEIKIADRDRRTIYQRERRQNKEERKISNRIGVALSRIVSGKQQKTKYDFGCTTKEIRDYFESKFAIGMSWDNYGEWEIDHIIAKSKFNQTNKEELEECWNYKNLRPLWKDLNRMKLNKEITNE